MMHMFKKYNNYDKTPNLIVFFHIHNSNLRKMKEKGKKKKGHLWTVLLSELTCNILDNLLIRTMYGFQDKDNCYYRKV